MLYLLQFYTFFVFVCLVLSNSLAAVSKNFLLVAILLLGIYAEATSSVENYNSTYFYTSLLARSVFIPSAYLYFRNRINKLNWTLPDLIHLLPFSLLAVAGIAIYASGPAISQGNEHSYFLPGSFAYSSLLLIIFGTALVYFFLLLQLFKHRARYWFEQEAVRQPVSVYLEEDKKADANGNNNITLSDKQILRMDQLVREFLESQQPFLQHRYSLKDLSEGTNIPLHHLSAFINKHYGVNFNDFINGFRVRYCMQKIMNRECEQKKLEAIAQESGFSNRNTFTSAFKKVTGVNPSQFLKTASISADISMEKKKEGQDLADEPAAVPMRYKLATDHF